MAREYDSDDGANGYDSTSSDEAELLIQNLDRELDQDENMSTYEDIDEEKLLSKEELSNQFMKLQTKMKGQKNLREFLNGV